jgi:hypothetical protein
MSHVIKPVYHEAEREAAREAAREAHREAQREARRKLVARIDARWANQRVVDSEARAVLASREATHIAAAEVARMDAMLVAQAVPATRGSPLVPVARVPVARVPAARNLLAKKLKQSLRAARDARVKRK